MMGAKKMLRQQQTIESQHTFWAKEISTHFGFITVHNSSINMDNMWILLITNKKAMLLKELNSIKNQYVYLKGRNHKHKTIPDKYFWQLVLTPD